MSVVKPELFRFASIPVLNLEGMLRLFKWILANSMRRPKKQNLGKIKHSFRGGSAFLNSDNTLQASLIRKGAEYIISKTWARKSPWMCIGNWLRSEASEEKRGLIWRPDLLGFQQKVKSKAHEDDKLRLKMVVSLKMFSLHWHNPGLISRKEETRRRPQFWLRRGGGYQLISGHRVTLDSSKDASLPDHCSSLRFKFWRRHWMALSRFLHLLGLKARNFEAKSAADHGCLSRRLRIHLAFYQFKHQEFWITVNSLGIRKKSPWIACFAWQILPSVSILSL